MYLKTGEEDFDSVVQRLKEEAGRRAEEIIRRQQRNAEEKKTTETGGDKGCPAFPDGGEVGAEIG